MQRKNNRRVAQASLLDLEFPPKRYLEYFLEVKDIERRRDFYESVGNWTAFNLANDQLNYLDFIHNKNPLPNPNHTRKTMTFNPRKRSYGGAFYPGYAEPIYPRKIARGGFTGYRQGDLIAMRAARMAAVRRANRNFPNRFGVSTNTKDEIRAVDIRQGTQGFGSTATFAVLNIPLPGTSFYNRLGNKINMKSIHLRGIISALGNNANADVNHLGRLMVVYDKQPNGAYPATADLLLDTDQAAATGTTVTSSINMNKRNRFVVLADMQVILPAVGVNGATAASTVNGGTDPNGNAGGPQQGQFNINRFIKLKNLEAIYRGAGGNIADLDTGSLLLFTFSNSANAAGSYGITLCSRLRFMD